MLQYEPFFILWFLQGEPFLVVASHLSDATVITSGGGEEGGGVSP